MTNETETIEERKKSNEHQMIEWFWREKIGGTLQFEFRMTNRNKQENHEARTLDGLILPDGERQIAKISPAEIRGRDIVIVQAKIGRLGMHLMGQAVFSRHLMERFEPKSIRSIALCEKTDSILAPFLKDHGVEVVTVEEGFLKPKPAPERSNHR